MTSNISETAGFGQNRPLKDPLGRPTPLHYFAGGVLLTEASEGHTTPVRTQPSPDIVSYVVGLALVLLELEKSGPPLPFNFIRSPPLCGFCIRAARLGNFHGKRCGGKR